MQGSEHIVDKGSQETNTHLQSPRSPALAGLLHSQQLLQAVKASQASDRAAQVKSKPTAFRHLSEDRELQSRREKTDICILHPQALVFLSLTSAPFSSLQQLSSRRVLPKLLLVVNPASIVGRRTLAHPRTEDNRTSSAMTSDPIVACGCGRTFLSKVALEQHRRDKATSVSSSKAPYPCDSIEVSHVPDSVPTESSKARRLLFLFSSCTLCLGFTTLVVLFAIFGIDRHQSGPRHSSPQRSMAGSGSRERN